MDNSKLDESEDEEPTKKTKVKGDKIEDYGSEEASSAEEGP